MRIIIGGMGKFGAYLCGELCHEGHEITVIDINTDVLERAMESYDVRTVEGSITSIDVQNEAEMSSAEVFMALTASDEVNITSSIIARQLGAKHTVARLRDQEYGAHMGFMRNNLGISYLLNPDYGAARYLAEMLQFPAVYAMERFINGAVTMMEADLAPESQLTGMNLINLGQLYPSLLVTAVARGEDIYIPRGKFVLQAHDIIQVTGNLGDLRRIYQEFQAAKKHYRNVLIVGGGRITYNFLRILAKSKLKICVIERDEERAMQLAGEFPQVEIIIGDGTDHKILAEANIQDYDIMLALTGLDELNMMINLHAQKSNVPRTVTKISRLEMLHLAQDFDLQTIVTPHRLAGEDIMRYIRAMDRSANTDVDAVYHLMNNRIEAVEMHVPKDSAVINKEIKDLKIKGGFLIAYIYRQGQVIIPHGKDKIRLHDRVVVISLGHRLLDLDEILED